MTRRHMKLTFLFALLGTSLVSGAAAACTKNEDLLQIVDVTAQPDVTPCDPIGRLYLDGLNGDRFFSFQDTQTLAEQHIFYGFARRFLHDLADLPEDDADFVGFDDAYASLIMSVFLTQTTSGVSVDRRKAYSAYAKLAYAQYAAIRGTAQSMLISAIDEELVGSSLTNRRELHCFVLHDMPQIAPEDIIASSAFKTCIATEE